MPRRRVRLRYSSDEEDDEEAEEVNTLSNHNNIVAPQPSTTSSPANPSPNTNLAEPVTISDDVLIDVSDDLTPSSPPNHDPGLPPPPPPLEPSSSGRSTGSPIEEFLSRMGLRLRRQWLKSCLQGLERSAPRFPSLDLAAKAKLCFEQFLFSDMNHSGGGVLPQNVASMHLVELTGPILLQVDEIVNMSCPLKGRYQDAPPGLKRCLKLSMTDGVQRVFGMEYRPIKDLKVLAPAGLKVVISNVQIRHGLLILVPEVLEVLGGLTEELEQARKRLVVELNKPPRGRRTRTGVVPSLATTATLAAWSLSGSNANDHVNSSVSGNAIPLQAGRQGNSSNASRTDIGLGTMDGPPASNSVKSTVSGVEHMHIDTVSVGSERAVSDIHSHAVPGFNGIHIMASRTSSSGSNIRVSSASADNSGEDIIGHQTSRVVSHDEMHIYTAPARNLSSISRPGSNATENIEVINMVDDVENPFISSREMKIPFTYLASLSAKWAAVKDNAPSVQGKIKCFLTGVKKFQYKQRATYDLLCYVDDGSLISEILIDHKVVENGVGHSPDEVSAALSSSDTKLVSGMKNNLRQFQAFLANFEGTMLVEINETSPHPVALEMSQGCSTSDARLLLERLKPSASRISLVIPSDPIDISP